MDESRRKVAVALHSLGDEFAPPQSDEREQPGRDASTREDESAEAAERRRRARQEILERGRMMEERRRAAAEEQQQQPNKGKGKSMSFDDLVDKDGSLKKEEAEPEVETPIATTTAAEPNYQSQQASLRHRGASTGESSNAAAALGATFANPFIDENFVDRFGSWEEARWAAENESQSRSPTPTLTSPPVPPKPAAYQPQTFLIDTTDVLSNHPSEQIINLTPTTTASSAAADLAELDQGDLRPQAASPESYLSVDEWAQEQSVHQSFHSPPQSLADAFIQSQQPHNNAALTSEGSVADSVEHASQAGTEDMDVMSEFEDGINTPSTWTEVGSMASE